MREHYRADINLFYRGMQFQASSFIRVTGVSQIWGCRWINFQFARDRKVDSTGPVYLYTRQVDTHSDTLVWAHMYIHRLSLVRVCSRFIGNRGMQVPVLVVVGTYTRSSLLGELEFLAADRILLRESRDAHDIQDVGVRLHELMRAHIHASASAG